MESARLQYPVTKAVDASDMYFGRRYADPYRWLENLQDEQTKAWFLAQADLADKVLAGIPGRDGLVDEWLALDTRSPAEYSAISYKNGRLFYRKTAGGERSRDRRNFKEVGKEVGTERSRDRRNLIRPEQVFGFG